MREMSPMEPVRCGAGTAICGPMAAIRWEAAR